jgi:hypothetical protein
VNYADRGSRDQWLQAEVQDRARDAHSTLEVCLRIRCCFFFALLDVTTSHQLLSLTLPPSPPPSEMAGLLLDIYLFKRSDRTAPAFNF